MVFVLVSGLELFIYLFRQDRIGMQFFSINLIIACSWCVHLLPVKGSCSIFFSKCDMS